MITLYYSANNSGGNWWLEDEDWLALEKAGWKVEWVKDQKDRMYRGGERWLGALATNASKAFETPDQGVAEFSDITGEDPWAEGCNCCGRPHSFSFKDDSGRTRYAETTVSTSFGGWS